MKTIAETKTPQERLKKLMSYHRLTQRETAYILGIHITTVQRWLADPNLKSSRRVSSFAVSALAYCLSKAMPSKS